MRNAVLFASLLVLVAAVAGGPAKNSSGSKFAQEQKKCLKTCPTDYTPVCGADDSGKKISFGNECVLGNYNCEQNANLRILSKGECPGGGGVRLS